MLRDHSQHNGRKLADVAAAIVESHLLLATSRPQPGPAERRLSSGVRQEARRRRASCASVIASR